MKKILFSFLAVAAVLAASCSKNNNTDKPDDNLVPMTFTASLDGQKALIDGVKVSWTAGDKISVFDNVTRTNYEFTTGDSGATAVFTGNVAPEAASATSFVAVYPYDGENAISDSEEFNAVSTVIPAVQKAPEGSADPAAILLTAKTEGNSFNFNHVCGFVTVTLSASDNISSVKLLGEPDLSSETNLCDQICGPATINVEDNSVTLGTNRAVTGLVELRPATGDTFGDGTYYIAVAPVVMARGLRLYFQRSTDSREALKAGTKVLEVGRKGVVSLGSPVSGLEWFPSVKESQSDVYVSPDGTGDGSAAGSAMSFAAFSSLISVGQTQSHTGLYPLYAWKASHFRGKTFHFAAGTYNFIEKLSTYFSGQTAVPVDFTLEGAGKEATIFDGGDASQMFYLNSTASVVVKGIKFQHGKASGQGGAMHINGKNYMEITDCAFESNESGTYAGALVSDAATNDVAIKNCVFTGNKSNTNAGALRIKGKAVVSGCTFTGNIAAGKGDDSNAGTGGALYIGENDTDVLVESCIFSGNKTEGQYATYGGAINVQNKSLTAVIRNCTFENNTSKTTGGAIQVCGPLSDVKVEGGSFTGNVATTNGGAIYGATDGAFSVDGASFTGNSASNGGAVCSYGPVTLKGCTLKNNYAATGGAIRIYKTSLTMDGGLLDGNYSTTNSGGAVYVGDDNASITAIGVTFSNNTSKTTGGGINFQNKIVTGSFVDCTFMGNTATTDSGAFHVAGGTSEFTFTDCLFSGNVAKGNGGVSYASEGTVKFNGCTLRDNSGKLGGAFYIGTGKCYMNACVMTGNTKSDAEVEAKDMNKVANALVGTSGSGYIGLHNCTVYTSASAKGDADVKFGGTSGPNGAVTCCTIVSDCATTGHLALASAYTATKGGLDNAAVMANIIKENAGTAAVGGYLPSKGYNLFNSGAFNAAATGDSNTVPALTATPSQSGLIYYLWDGNVTPMATKTDIQAAIQASHTTFGPAFDEFITACGGYGKDVAGNTRNASSIWPGSYQAE